MMMRKEFPAFLLLLSLLGSCQGKFLQPLTAPLRFAKALRGQLTKIVLPDVYLPEDKSLFKGANFLSNLFDLTGISSIEILNFNMKGGAKAALAVRGKSKSDPTVFDDFHSNFVENIIQHKHLLPDGYKFFGSNNNVENLNLFIKHNPFAASALSKVGEKIAIVSMGDSAGPTSWFKRAVDLLDDSYPRVVATFSDDLTLQDITAYDSFTRQPLVKSREEAAGDLLFLLTYYFEFVHATIHILHYIMTAALKTATEDYPMLSAWAAPYVQNIAIKYVEVETLLLNDNGVLTGLSYKTKTGNGEDVRKLAREVLCAWGSVKTANEFVEKFLLASISKTDQVYYGILPEFSKHVALVGEFSEKLSNAFEQYDEAKFIESNKKLAEYLSKTGPGVSSIANLRSWIELMSVTGIMHGSTISLTRFFVTTENLKRFNPKKETYDLEDVLNLLLGASTIVGVIEDRHVFSSSLIQPTVLKTLKGTTYFDPIAANVLQDFDARSAKLKKDSYDELSKDPVNFAKNGWILSDFFPDGIDGKQLTLTTYI